MKKNAKQALRDKTADELNKLAGEARGEMLKMRISKSVEGKAIGVKYRSLRRSIARYETLMTEKAEKVAAGSVANKGTK